VEGVVAAQVVAQVRHHSHTLPPPIFRVDPRLGLLLGLLLGLIVRHILQPLTLSLLLLLLVSQTSNDSFCFLSVNISIITRSLSIKLKSSSHILIHLKHWIIALQHLLILILIIPSTRRFRLIINERIGTTTTPTPLTLRTPPLLEHSTVRTSTPPPSTTT